MVQGQRAEDRNPDRYKIVDGVSGDVEGRDVVSHEVERALGQGVDEQAFLGSEEAVDGPRRRAGLCGDGSHGECSGSAVGNERYFVPAIGRPLADALPFPDGAFDLVLCQLGLQFFPDRLGALREMRRVLAPSGRTLVSSRGRHPRSSPSSRTPWQRPSPPDVAAFVRVVFSLHEPDELRGLVADAGFRRSDARGPQQDAPVAVARGVPVAVRVFDAAGDRGRGPRRPTLAPRSRRTLSPPGNRSRSKAG
jgi:SAM-dependent methyltransferase